MLKSCLRLSDSENLAEVHQTARGHLGNLKVGGVTKPRLNCFDLPVSFTKDVSIKSVPIDIYSIKTANFDLHTSPVFGTNCVCFYATVSDETDAVNKEGWLGQ